MTVFSIFLKVSNIRRISVKLRIKVDGRTKSETSGISLEVQWLTLCTSNEGDTGSIPGQGTKIPRAAQ